MRDKTQKMMRNVRHEMQERGAFSVDKLNELHDRRLKTEQTVGQVALLPVVEVPAPHEEPLDLPLAS